MAVNSFIQCMEYKKSLNFVLLDNETSGLYQRVLNAKPSESEWKSDCKTEQRETEGTWLQLLRSCALHLLCCSRFQRCGD